MSDKTPTPSKNMSKIKLYCIEKMTSVDYKTRISILSKTLKST